MTDTFGAATNKFLRSFIEGETLRRIELYKRLSEMRKRDAPLCYDHTSYKATHKPRRTCPKCWQAWCKAHSSETITAGDLGKVLESLGEKMAALEKAHWDGGNKIENSILERLRSALSEHDDCY